ncbi:hypothetical protein J2T61_001359 [Methanocalculus sp. AMF5]|nr:hypothetical protein [Methanocalculus sp. AMF5]
MFGLIDMNRQEIQKRSDADGERTLFSREALP